MLKPVLFAGLLVVTGCIVGEDGTGLPVDDDDPPVDNPEPEAPTGVVMMSFTTAPQGVAPPAGFAPNNAVVVWVEDAAGTFVKTINRQSQVRTQHLVAWNQAAGPGDLDGVSGASRTNHAAPVSFMWKMKDRNKQPIADGTYTVRVEVTEVNAVTAAENQQATFTFTSGAVPETQTGLTDGAITNVSIAFTPPP